MQVGAGGEQAGDGGFADAGRAPEDERGEGAAGEHAGKAALRAKQMLLAGDVAQGARAQAFGQRLALGWGRSGFGGGEQIILGHGAL